VVDLKIYDFDRSELLHLSSCTSDVHKGNSRIILLNRPYDKDFSETPTVWIKHFVCDRYSSWSYVFANISSILL